MKKLDKDTRALMKMAAKLGALGVTVDTEQIQESIKITPITESDKLESVLASIRRPGDYTYRTCKRLSCQQPFGSNYRAVAYCSDFCRIRDFEATTGIEWLSNRTPEQRWGGEPPLIIPPDVVYRMFEYAKLILHHAEVQGWVSPEGTLLPDFLNQSATELNQHDPNPSELDLVENGQTIFLSQPSETMSLVIEQPISDGGDD